MVATLLYPEPLYDLPAGTQGEISHWGEEGYTVCIKGPSGTRRHVALSKEQVEVSEPCGKP